MIEHIVIKNLNIREYVIGKLLSTSPPHELMDKFLNMNLATYTGGFCDDFKLRDDFKWDPNSDSFRRATTESLILAYNEIAEYWNRRSNTYELYAHKDLIEYEIIK